MINRSASSRKALAIVGMALALSACGQDISRSSSVSADFARLERYPLRSYSPHHPTNADEMFAGSDLVVQGTVVDLVPLPYQSPDDPVKTQYVSLVISIDQVVAGDPSVKTVEILWEAFLLDSKGKRRGAIVQDDLTLPAVDEQLVLFLTKDDPLRSAAFGLSQTYSLTANEGLGHLLSDGTYSPVIRGSSLAEDAAGRDVMLGFEKPVEVVGA